MYRGFKIGVSVPAYNEEEKIEETLRSIPDFVDSIIVANDASIDKTKEIIQALMEEDDRIFFIDNKINCGVGESIISFHNLNFKEYGCGYIGVLAGDNQMDPKYLPRLLDLIIENKINFVKGNRFNIATETEMPLIRKIGNVIISFFDSIASGSCILI